MFLVALPIGAVVLTSDAGAAVALGLLLPVMQDLLGGGGSVHISPSDVILVLIFLRLLLEGSRTRQLAELRALRPVRLPLLQYLVFVLILLALHFDGAGILKTLQRFELLGLPLLAGAFIALRGQETRFLKAYIVGSTVLAVVWPVLHNTSFGAEFQKNPVGQVIANAVLILISVRQLRRFLPCLPLLAIGLGLTASRGAVVSVAAGLVVLSLYSFATNPRVAVARSLALVVAGAVAYGLLPASTQSRLTTFSTSSVTAASYPILAREAYARDAGRIISAHPWTGIGVGNYLTTSLVYGSTTDPHDVILLQAAEGGYLFAVSFVLLVLGALVCLWHLRGNWLAPAAAAVMAATVAHGLVDVYWVRVTPVLSWTLLGIVMAQASAHRLRLTANPAAADG